MVAVHVLISSIQMNGTNGVGDIYKGDSSKSITHKGL